MHKADTNEEFEASLKAAIEKEVTSTTSFTWTQPPIDESGHVDLRKGYQPDEFLLGHKLLRSADGTDESKIYKEGGRVAFPSPGIFGHCSDSDYLKFMENEEANSCVVKEVAEIDETACA